MTPEERIAKLERRLKTKKLNSLSTVLLHQNALMRAGYARIIKEGGFDSVLIAETVMSDIDNVELQPEPGDNDLNYEYKSVRKERE